MMQNAAFHQGLLCLLKENQSSEKEMKFCGGGGEGGIITCNPSIYTKGRPDLIVSNSYGAHWCG